ncbi:MAG: type II toxin-antitoxin system RelE family toxin [Methylobacter sp.]
MKIQISKRFVKDTQKITDKRILAKIQQVIIETSQAERLANVSDVEEMTGFPNFYRIKFDYRYRIGIYCENDLIQFLRVDHREGFYKKFP